MLTIACVLDIYNCFVIVCERSAQFSLLSTGYWKQWRLGIVVLTISFSLYDFILHPNSDIDCLLLLEKKLTMLKNIPYQRVIKRMRLYLHRKKCALINELLLITRCAKVPIAPMVISGGLSYEVRYYVIVIKTIWAKFKANIRLWAICA